MINRLAAVAAVAGCTLVLSATVLATPPTPLPTAAHFQTCQDQTGRNASVVVAPQTMLYLIGWRSVELIEPGDELAAFTPEGTCAGTLTWSGNGAVLSMWADDPMTSEKDGFTPGDALSFRAWNASTGQELVSLFTLFTLSTVPGNVFGRSGLYLPNILVFGRSRSLGGRFAGVTSEAEFAQVISDIERDLGGTPAATALPETFALDANYPNPFDGSTTIRYGLPEAADVTLEIYDTLGRAVTTLVAERQEPGWHETAWDATGLAAGLYIARLRAGDFVAQRQMLVVR